LKPNRQLDDIVREGVTEEPLNIMKSDHRLLLLHGFTCDPSSGDDQTACFSKLANVSAPLLPPHGRSQLPAPPTLETLADFVRERFLDESGRALVVGHSMGGMIALLLALRYPEQLSGIVLLDAYPALSLNATVMPELHGPKTPTVVQERATAMMLAGDRNMEPAARRKLWRSIETIDMIGELSSLSVPLLAIYGGRGRFRADQTDELKRALRLDLVPACELMVVPGAGHFVHWEAPELINQRITRFLQTLTE
jgi:pimeloyl-ACP methyl ester carboxylesterase